MNGDIIMKKNEIFTAVSNVADYSISMANSQARTAASKKEAREISDKVVNNFIDDLPSLCIVLTDMFESLSKVDYFGNPEAKTPTGQSVAAKNKQNAGRFFARSLKALDIGYTLKGTSPFTLVKVEVKAKKDKEETMIESLVKCGADTIAIEVCKKAIADSIERAAKRQEEIDELANELKEDKDSDKRNSLVSNILTSGITAEQLEELAKTIKNQSSC